jgi:hypothetical protein
LSFSRTHTDRCFWNLRINHTSFIPGVA